MKKIISFVCLVIITLGTLVPIQKASANNGVNGDPEELVKVVLYSDETKVIMSEVPRKHLVQYQSKLKNQDFRNLEIIKSTESEEGVSIPTKLAASMSYGSVSPSAVIQPSDGGTSSGYVKYMTKYDILRIIDSIDNTHDWPRYFSNPLTDAAVAAGVAVLTKIPNFSIAAVTATAWSASDLANRQTAWWKDSAIMIWRGTIRGVKLTVKPNTTSNYPAAYITLVRY